MSKCLVTGGAGFLGSHLVDKLIDEGHEVVVIDNLSLGKEKFVNEEAEFYQKDITDLEEIKPFFYGADVVFHVAADPRLQASLENPVRSHEVNVRGTLNVLQASVEKGVDKVVFSSSGAIYGDKEKLPISEEAQPDPNAPYPAHKLMGEKYMEIYSKLHDIDTVCLRYFNIYGPRKTTKGGYPMVIPAFLEQRQEGKPMTIVGDGKQTRDYVHVFDVVKANIKAWKSGYGDADVFNIGSGIQVSVNEIADVIGGETKHIAEREGEIRFSEADISKAKEKLGWKPRIEFEQGLEDLMKYWGVSNGDKTKIESLDPQLERKVEQLI
ncbi:MAG: NAD-dependent epimerase/dehydratase family protein [Candidatus Paceibacteria bacterium]